ncbi:MAG: insulinase family protein [Methylobacterium mesophilicum]|nr:insulinase family protein [Methylobacterium mesophilicum]
MMRRFLAVVLFSLAAFPAHAIEIREVVSSKGVKAWLVEDRTLPLLTMRFAFKGGSTQDPAGKDGLSTLMSGLFDEGAGSLQREAFQTRLDETGAEMSFNASQDAMTGSMRLLTENRDAALGLLRDAVNAPRFDPEPFERIRAQLLSGIVSRANDPQAQASRRWSEALYGKHPYARDDSGTKASLESITPDDLRALRARTFARSNLIIGVVGDIDPETLKRALDRVFGDLPADPQLTPVPDVKPLLAQEILIPYELPQASIQLAYPGVARDDPRFFAAVLMNQVLGGDEMGSRLFEEVREKRGLAYGIGSSLAGFDHSQSLVIGTATRAERAGETLDVIRNVVKGMAEKGPSEEELNAAKRYLIGAYAISNLGSSSSIASTLVGLQLDHLPIDYMDRRAGFIEGVTVEQARQAARDLLLAEPAVMVVGPRLPKPIAP